MALPITVVAPFLSAAAIGTDIAIIGTATIDIAIMVIKHITDRAGRNTGAIVKSIAVIRQDTTGLYSTKT
ncbi:hypothetical protein [Rhizobium sp. NXC24]|uniref:hypothetical protein n=1 Tax=Rhizobium sp. NXC24 TaxID=2048897 RepID=UPI000CDF3C97|nr:hypothetical protein [Rhizobium sp. NXC24]AVA23802.1 hypothetical protein NXC24_PA00156 [Rhizobium sp. NXC24]